MREDEPEDDSEDLSAARAELRRLGWAPVIANGAAMIAMAGIVGGAPSPDAALGGLTWPTAIFGIGLGLGALAVQASGSSQLTDARDRKAQKRYSRIAREMNFFGDNAPLKRLIFKGEEAHAEPQEPYDMERVRQVSESLRRIEPGDKDFHAARRWRATAKLSGIGSLVAFAIGLSTLLIGHALGVVRLEPPPANVSEPAPPSPRPVPAAPASSLSGSARG